MEAVREQKTISEIAKKQLLGGASLAFESNSVSSKGKDDEPEAAELYEQIGRLKVEL